MDSLIAAAARALVAGDALSALKRVGLRDDPPALALRGIAMAQLGEHPRARELLRRAARGFGAHEDLARARCVVAEAEVALAMRDLRGSPRTLAAASATLEARADRANALLQSEPQVVVAWSTTDDEPEIIGDPSLVTDLAAPDHVLVFGRWLVALETGLGKICSSDEPMHEPSRVPNADP